MFYTDDPIADYERYDAEQQAQLDKLPKCCECKEHIQQEDAVCFKGKYICDECLEDLRVDLIWGDDS